MSTYISRAYPKLIFALLITIFGSFIYLAEAEEGVSEPAPEQFVCSEFYPPDSINLQVFSQAETVAASTPLTFTGSVENKNTFPIVEGQVWVKIYQVENADNLEKKKRVNHVATFLAADNVTIPAFSKTPLNFSWTSPNLLVSGNYDATYYFVSSDRFYHFGLPYLEGGEKAQGSFKVAGGDNQTVYFDWEEIKLNNQPYDFTSKYPKFFGREEIVYVQGSIVNPTSEEKIVEVTWKTSNWGGKKADALPVVDKQFLTLKPGVKYAVSHMPLHLGGAVTLVEAEVKNGDNVSLFQVWFARSDVEDARISLASITNYPLEGNKDNQIFACVEGVPGLVASELNLNLRLLDKKGREVLSENKLVKLLAGPGGAVSSFTTKSYSGTFTLEATLKSGDKVLDQVQVPYDCATLDPDNCRQGFALPAKLPFVAVIVGLLGLLLLVRHRRKYQTHIIAE